jgi:hypothetical protein
MRLWALMITHGTMVEYPPELYLTESVGVRESRRWAWILAGHGEMAVANPFEGRWEVGTRDVRLVECSCEHDTQMSDCWVGTHWTSDGYPEPEALVLPGRRQAYRWVTEPEGARSPRDIEEREWSISATFGSGDHEAYSVALRAKVVLDDSRRVQMNVDYEVEITGTFVQTVRGSVSGPPGLGRRAIEERIEERWGELSAAPELLLESSWELESFHQVD